MQSLRTVVGDEQELSRLHARALVMETGGVLSHGAIVAREFGLPAVAGLPEVHRRVRTGQRLRVDGSTGRVNVLA